MNILNLNFMSTLTKLLAITSVSFSLTACNSTQANVSEPVVNVNCVNVSGVNLNDAIHTAKNSLTSGQCNQYFAENYQNLLVVAKGAPGKENKKVFDTFLKWSFDQSIISKVDAKHYFNRYFGERFVTLNETYNTCSQGTKQQAIFNALDTEMQDKALGLLDVLGDKEMFNKVARQKKDLKMVLEATWLACEA